MTSTSDRRGPLGSDIIPVIELWGLLLVPLQGDIGDFQMNNMAETVLHRIAARGDAMQNRLGHIVHLKIADIALQRHEQQPPQLDHWNNIAAQRPPAVACARHDSVTSASMRVPAKPVSMLNWCMSRLTPSRPRPRPV